MNEAENIHQVEVQKTWSPWGRFSANSRAQLRRIWATLGFNHDTAAVVRYELDMVMLRLYCWASPKHRSMIRSMSARRNLKVHLGCGNALLEGWVNLDCYPPAPAADREVLVIDMRRGLPFADAAVDVVFSEHFLEHLPVEIVRDSIIPEMKRILGPGGFLRISVPNGAYFIDQYVKSRANECDPVYVSNSQGKTPMTMLNEITHSYGHYFVYDFETMRRLLEAQRCSTRIATKNGASPCRSM